MGVRFTLLAMMCLVVGSALPAAGQQRMMMRMEHRGPEDVSLPGGETAVVMERFGHRPMVQVTVNGKGPFPFIFDTGAGATVITRELADELGLDSVGVARVGDPTGRGPLISRMVRVDSMAMGGVRLRGLTTTTLPAGTLPRDSFPARGVLSPNDFRGLVVSYDFPASRVRVRTGELPEPDGTTVFAYDAPRGIPAVPCRVGGLDLVAHLDTGSPSGFTLPLSRAGDLTLEGEPREAGRGRTVTGAMVFYEAGLRGEASLCGHTFTNPTLRFNERIPHVNVGAALLGEFVLAVDPKNRRLQLTRSE